MPDNAIYYYVTYCAAALVYGGYVVALMLRNRKARDRERQMHTGVARGR